MAMAEKPKWVAFAGLDMMSIQQDLVVAETNTMAGSFCQLEPYTATVLKPVQ